MYFCVTLAGHNTFLKTMYFCVTLLAHNTFHSLYFACMITKTSTGHENPVWKKNSTLGLLSCFFFWSAWWPLIHTVFCRLLGRSQPCHYPPFPPSLLAVCWRLSWHYCYHHMPPAGHTLPADVEEVLGASQWAVRQTPASRCTTCQVPVDEVDSQVTPRQDSCTTLSLPATVCIQMHYVRRNEAWK